MSSILLSHLKPNSACWTTVYQPYIELLKNEHFEKLLQDPRNKFNLPQAAWILVLNMLYKTVKFLRNKSTDKQHPCYSIMFSSCLKFPYPGLKSTHLDNDDGMEIVLLVFGKLLSPPWLPKWPGPGGICPITPRGPIDRIPLLQTGN